MSTIHRFSHEAMSTTFDALIIHEDKAYAGQAAAAVFAEVHRIETLLSRHDPGTDIARINRLTPGQHLAVSIEVIDCLEAAARTYVQTNGAFDPAFRSTAGGTRPSAMDTLLLSRPDNPNPTEPVDFLVGIDSAAADNQPASTTEVADIASTTQITEPADNPHTAQTYQSVDLDLGAIGKGFALDCALTILADYSIDNFLLNSGTSTVLARGPGPEGKGWTVGVSGDFRAETGVGYTDLQNVALSGSGTALKGEHIRDPKTGQPAPARAAWVKAQTAAETDALSTALMVMPPTAARKLLETLPGISAIVVYPDPEPPLVHGQW